MHVLTGPYLAACLLLAVGGLWKLHSPHPAVRALSGVGLPASWSLVRLLGLGELALGSIALLSGARWAAGLVALAYLAFAGFVLVTRTRSGSSSCGCFGTAATPPSLVHVALDLTLAGTAALVAVASAPERGLSVTGGTGDLVLAGWSILLTWLLYLAMTELPRTIAAARS